MSTERGHAWLGVAVLPSLGLHALAGVVLFVVSQSDGAHAEEEILQEFELVAVAPAAQAPEPAIVPAPPPPEPAAVPEPEPPRRARAVEPEPEAEPPEVVEPEPAPPVEPVPEPAVEPAVEAPGPAGAAQAEPNGLPSLDDVYGAPGGSGYFPSGGGGGGGGSGVGSGSGAPRPVGPSEADVRRARRQYVRRIEELLQAQARYPAIAQRAGQQGRVELALRVSRDGRLVDVRVISSSGFVVLDHAAIEAARRVSPPAPPDIVPWGAAEEVRAPVRYQLFQR